MAKYCMFCGESLPDTAQFCPSCGRKQNDEADNVQETERNPASDDEIDLLLKYGMASSATPKKEEKPQKIIKIDSSPEDLLADIRSSETTEEEPAENPKIIHDEPRAVVHKPHSAKQVDPFDILNDYEVKTKEKPFSAPEPQTEPEREYIEPDIPMHTEEEENAQTGCDPEQVIPEEPVNTVEEAEEVEDVPEPEIPASDEETDFDIPEETAISSPIRPSSPKKDDFVFEDDDEDEDDDFGVIITEEEPEPPKPNRRQAARRDVSVKKRSISIDEAEDEFNTDINTASGGGINFDSEKIHADERKERENRKNAVIEDDGDRSSLEGRTQNTQKQAKRRQSQRNYNDKKIYIIEHDRSAIDENEDPNYDGYYENVLPVDYDRDVKKNIDWKLLGIILTFLGFITGFVIFFATYLI